IGPYAVQRSRRSALYTDGGFRERAQPAAIAKFRPHLPPWDRFGIPEFVVRSEGLEPPRCYSLPPQGSASTNSATSAKKGRHGICAGPPHRRRCNKSQRGGQVPLASLFAAGFRARFSGYLPLWAAFALLR